MKAKMIFSLILIAFFASLIPAVQAQTFTVLHNFTAGIDGAQPAAGVTMRGNALYGTTWFGPCGTVYQMTHSGSNWLFSTVAELSNVCSPTARVVFGPDGHLYGTSAYGGTYSAGTVFKLTPPVGICKTAACYWTVNNLHDFGSGTDGQNPWYGDLIWDQQGNIYGTTVNGGASPNCGGGCGTVFELTPSGNGYTETVLYSFSGPDGFNPVAGLVFDTKGNLFGTTEFGGSNNFGNVFELSYVVGVGWTEHVLYEFQNRSDGQQPIGGLIFDSTGNLYGTTVDNGSGGGGTIFELSPSGDTWTYKLLYSIGGGDLGPVATLSMDGAGNLYGTTLACGMSGYGSVFELSNTENGWVYTSLHDFTGGADGRNPISNVSIDTDGTLYGTARQGGSTDNGVVWMIKP